MSRPRLRQERLGGLDCQIVEAGGEGRGLVVVLLHGFGAPGGDLVPLAGAVPLPPGSIVVCPAAPLELEWGFDSRAWWMIDVARLERAAMSGRPVELPREEPEGLAPARAAVIAMLEELDSRESLDGRLLLGGFSQGAMLACDVALRLPRAPAGLSLFSPTILLPDEWPQLMPRLAGARVVISHGSLDPLLPFAASERLRDMLASAGADVRWVPFRGGHEIPGPALQAFATLIADLAGA